MRSLQNERSLLRMAKLVSSTETTDLLCGKDYTGTKSMVKASSSLTLRWTVSAREILKRLGGFEIVITGFQQPESSGCAKGMTRCSNDRCVWSGFKCDGKDNCGDYSDERLCSAYPFFLSRMTVVRDQLIRLHFVCLRRRKRRKLRAAEWREISIGTRA
ncbi:uncharacterized protein LOC142769403 [Rhipicephalus microplus]|uniref:uncharacterized protein LOC142769403 n=1 Tax=Rhipicephalus microplus TaxID=6941 RepID=UPI003F6A7107